MEYKKVTEQEKENILNNAKFTMEYNFNESLKEIKELKDSLEDITNKNPSFKRALNPEIYKLNEIIDKMDQIEIYKTILQHEKSLRK